MKIVRIVSDLDFGGVEQVLANSVPALVQKEGVELRILVLGQGGIIANHLIGEGLEVRILGTKPRIPNVQLIYTLSKILFQLKPDVVHTQGSEANFHGILAAKLVGVPRIIGEEIGIPNHHSYWKWIFKYVYSQAHQVIAISEAVKNAIVGLGEVKEEKVKVVYNPVEGKRLEKRDERRRRIESNEFVQLTNLVRGQATREGEQKTDKKFVFITTCRLVPIKNLDRLIQAFADLVKENANWNLLLRIVGEGPERENIEKDIRDKGLEKSVEILGFQSNVWPFLQESDAFILPSLREGSSVSLTEAMTAGLPSIVTQVGGANEILGDSRSRFLIDPLDLSSIQYAMQQMLDLSPEERLSIGERVKKEAQRFSVDNYIKELLKIYYSPIS